MFIGTCSDPLPTLGFSEPMNIDVAKAADTGLFMPYMMNDTYVAANYDSIPSGNNCWRWTTCASSQIFLFGGNVNAPDVGGNPDDPYVAIEVCQDVPTTLYQPFVYVDEISIAIY